MATVSIVECQKRALKMEAQLCPRGCDYVDEVRQHARDHRIDPPQQMARWYPPLEIEHINELALIAFLPPHHGRITRADPSQHRIILSRGLPAGFSTPSATS